MRAAKLAAARQKLRDHQDKKQSIVAKDGHVDSTPNSNADEANSENQNKNTESNYKDFNIADINLCKNEEADETLNKLSHSTTVNEDDSKLKHEIQIEQVHANEILIMDNRKLEAQASHLHYTIGVLENNLAKTANEYNMSKQHIQRLETELKSMKADHARLSLNLSSKENHLAEAILSNKSLNEKLSELMEQFDFTKTTLIAKQNENASLQSQLSNIQSQLDITQLHLQQLTNGNELIASKDSMDIEQLAKQNQMLMQKLSNLEQKLKSTENEYDQRIMHYEQYVNQVNEQLKDATSRNSQLLLENESLASREISLVDQISDMEKQLQNLKGANTQFGVINFSEEKVHETQKKYDLLEDTFRKLKTDYDHARNELMAASMKIQEQSEKLQHAESSNLLHSNLDITKLNADITSDKIAAQKAITQNKKLKKEVEDLQEAFVKMSKDKLELVEKLDAEKFLNRELTIKLAEVADKSNDLMPKLLAKDNEMIRLQAHCSEAEKNIADQRKEIDGLRLQVSSYRTELANARQTIATLNINNKTVTNSDEIETHDNQMEMYQEKCEHNVIGDGISSDLSIMSLEEAMLKLQDRFLNKMKEVAELSDEKQKLEHLVLQLQNETDTICEYVALYQQQRGILKKREEERNAQIKFFDGERERMKSQLDDLTKTITKFSEDKDLQNFLQDETRQEDVYKIHQLVTNIKNNHFIKSNKQYTDFEAFHPCAWCSGKLIDV